SPSRYSPSRGRAQKRKGFCRKARETSPRSRAESIRWPPHPAQDRPVRAEKGQGGFRSTTSPARAASPKTTRSTRQSRRLVSRSNPFASFPVSATSIPAAGAKGQGKFTPPREGRTNRTKKQLT